MTRTTTGGGALPTDDELELRRSLADFTLMFVRTMMQASYYAPDHPAHQRGTSQAYSLLAPLLQHSREITFVTGSLSDTSDIQIDGVLSEPIGVRSLLQSAMGEHFVAKYLEYFDRNELVSFAIKHDIERDEFNRFMGAVVEHRLDVGEDEAARGRIPFDEVLEQVQVVHISVMCRDEIVGAKRRIPWGVRVALSRLRKDLKMIPLYCRASQKELHEVKTMLVQDVIRPLRRVDLMRDLLLNADLISQEIADEASIDVDQEIVRNLHPDMAATLAGRLADEVVTVRGGTDDARGFGTVELRHQRLVSAVRNLSIHMFQGGARCDLGLVRKLFDQKILALRELPGEVRRVVQVERWTDQFLSDPRTHLERLASIAHLEPFKDLLTVVRLITEELIRRRTWSDAHGIVKALERLYHQAQHPFPERPALVREALDRLCDESILRPLVEALCAQAREDRGGALQLLTALGQEAVPFMLEALLFVEDAATRRELCTSIERVGQPAGKYLLMEAESFNHKWYFYRNLVMLLGRIRYEDAAPAIQRLLGHFHGRVREEAVGALARVRRRQCEPALMPLLHDPDPAVVKRVIASLRTLRCRSDEYLAFLRDTALDAGSEGADPGVAAAAVRALRDLGNASLPSEGEHADVEDVEDVLLAVLDPGRRRLFRRAQRAPEEVRAAACEILGVVGSEAAVPALQRARGEAALAQAAGEALAMLERRAAGRAARPS